MNTSGCAQVKFSIANLPNKNPASVHSHALTHTLTHARIEFSTASKVTGHLRSEDSNSENISLNSIDYDSFQSHDIMSYELTDQKELNL